MTFAYLRTTPFIRLSSYQIVFVMREPGKTQTGYGQEIEIRKVWRMNGTQDSKIEGPKLSVTVKIL